MPNNALDLAKLYSDDAKGALAKTLVDSARLNLIQATPYQLIKILLKDRDVSALLLSLGLEEKLFQNLEKEEKSTKITKLERLSFSLELKKLFFWPTRKA